MFLQMTVTASILIASILILRFFRRDKFPQMTFLLLWALVLVRLLLPISFQTHFSIQTLFNLEHNSQVVADVAISSNPVLSTDLPIFNWTNVWLFGVAIMAIYFVIAYWKLQRQLRFALPLTDNQFINGWLRRNPIRRRVKILVCDQINTPLTTGVFLPKIYLPKQLDFANELQLEYILSHEMHHIKRLDIVWKLFTVCALCLHWFNPLVWLMALFGNRDLELTCDAVVVKKYGLFVKQDYALTLLGLAQQRNGFMPLHSAFARNAIEERVKAVVNLGQSSLLGLILLVMLLPLLVFTAFATPLVIEELPLLVTTVIEPSAIDKPELVFVDDATVAIEADEPRNESATDIPSGEPYFEAVVTLNWVSADEFAVNYELTTSDNTIEYGLLSEQY